MTPPSTATSGQAFRAAIVLSCLSFACLLAAGTVFAVASAYSAVLLLGAVGALLGAVSAVLSIVHLARTRGLAGRGMVVAVVVLSALLGLGGVAIGFVSMVAAALGAAWGRPLRVRGRVLHPELRRGSDWTRGASPEVASLDRPTRAALEQLWLHDAQKEHASVPAFARISWMLAAMGAPAELMEGAHRAALEEIDHARRCFALAAGYGGRATSVEPMPDLLLGGLDFAGDARVHLAVESLRDGCLLEDFNADVAAQCERACVDPAARDVLGRIAREERSHAELSWSILAWLVEVGGERVTDAIAHEVPALGGVPRPTAASGANLPLVARADSDALRSHGRIPDAEWAPLWRARVAATSLRARRLIDRDHAQAA